MSGLARRPRHGIRAAAAATALALPLAASGQWSGSVSIDSDYRYRGVSLSGSKPAVRLDGNYDSAAGWYAGGAAIQAQVADRDRYGQLFGYGGYALDLGSARSLEFGATYSHFSGKGGGYDFAEAYAGVLAQNWSVRLNYSPDYFGRHVRTAYLDASGHWPASDRFRLFGHAGVLAPLSGSYPGDTDAHEVRADLLLGIGWTSGSVDLRVAWTTASPGGPFPVPDRHRPRGAWLLGASYSF